MDNSTAIESMVEGLNELHNRNSESFEVKCLQAMHDGIKRNPKEYGRLGHLAFMAATQKFFEKRLGENATEEDKERADTCAKIFMLSALIN